MTRGLRAQALLFQNCTWWSNLGQMWFQDATHYRSGPEVHSQKWWLVNSGQSSLCFILQPFRLNILWDTDQVSFNDWKNHHPPVFKCPKSCLLCTVSWALWSVSSTHRVFTLKSLSDLSPWSRSWNICSRRYCRQLKLGMHNTGSQSLKTHSSYTSYVRERYHLPRIQV